MLFGCRVTNQDGQVAIDGTADVIAPAEKIKRPAVVLPEVQLEEVGLPPS